MSEIPIPSRDLPLDVRLVLVLLGLSPAMLASWMQTRFPRPLARLPIDAYSLVLLVLAVASYLALGQPPRWLADSWSPAAAILVGVAAGAVSIAVDMAATRLGRRRPRRAPPRRPTAPVPADVPVGDAVVWRLRDHGPAWRRGLGNLLTPAVLEELLYRQALLALLVPTLGLAAAAALSIAAFGLVHVYYGAPAVISKWIVGTLYTAVVLFGGGLLAAVVAHCLLNTAAYAAASPRARSMLRERLRERQA
jgi:membrane protease YdiL (CAAX protease family)